MRLRGMQERIAGIGRSPFHAACIAGGVVRSRKAAGHIVDGLPLCVIEDVESFGAELHMEALTEVEVFVQRHIKVRSSREAQLVTTCISEGEPPRQNVS